MHEKLTVLFYLYLNNLEDHSTIIIINYIRISLVAGFLSVSLFSLILFLPASFEPVSYLHVWQTNHIVQDSTD